MSNDESFIAIQSVSKHFGKVKAVDDITLNIRRGEFFSLLGASGCGKTTLLRMLAGFESPTMGELFIDGQPMSAVVPNYRPVNMVFQNYAIFPHLNVRQNIAYGLRKDNLSKQKMTEMVDEMLDLIALPGYGDRGSDELSGGQRQRVALARALIKRPKVLLLDEPLGALDKKLREQMQLELRDLQRSVGITFVFVTHDQEEALTMSDRIAVMEGGKVLQVDSPTRLYELPRSRAVADFIGSMNFFEAKVESVSANSAMVDAGPLGRIPALTGDLRFSVGDTALVAIRPEKMALSAEKQENGHIGVNGIVDAAAYLGDRNHYYVRVNGIDQPVAVSSQNLTRALEGSIGEKRTVWVQWPEDAAVLLHTD